MVTFFSLENAIFHKGNYHIFNLNNAFGPSKNHNCILMVLHLQALAYRLTPKITTLIESQIHPPPKNLHKKCADPYRKILLRILVNNSSYRPLRGIQTSCVEYINELLLSDLSGWLQHHIRTWIYLFHLNGKPQVFLHLRDWNSVKIILIPTSSAYGFTILICVAIIDFAIFILKLNISQAFVGIHPRHPFILYKILFLLNPRYLIKL